jgi:hypothetical protein
MKTILSGVKKIVSFPRAKYDQNPVSFLVRSDMKTTWRVWKRWDKRWPQASILVFSEDEGGIPSVSPLWYVGRPADPPLLPKRP